MAWGLKVRTEQARKEAEWKEAPALFVEIVHKLIGFLPGKRQDVCYRYYILGENMREGDSSDSMFYQHRQAGGEAIQYVFRLCRENPALVKEILKAYGND